MRGIVKKACELLESTPNAFMLQQFYNPANTQNSQLLHIESRIILTQHALKYGKKL
ncbi:hypothetical protein KY284_013232 [Solanum tuberosum]|nr:hypothetical protein KY284_013232 [Solanum tuberosum]